MTADDSLANDLAAGAGQRLVDLRSRCGFRDAAGLRAAGDRSSHEYITAALASRRPGDAVLSEEDRDDPARLVASRVWIVDPLDGTREFGEAGRTDWAVHIALWQRAGRARGQDGAAPGPAPGVPRGRLVAGAVALPAEGRTFSTLPGQAGAAAAPSRGGAQTLSRERATPAQPLPGTPRGTGPCGGRLRLIVSRTRPPEFVRKLAAEIGADLVPLGSAGAKIMSVLTGAADAYVHAGGQYEWDSAAPVAVARAAGLHASRADGSALEYNQPDPKLPDILVCRPAIAGPLLAAIRSVRDADD